MNYKILYAATPDLLVVEINKAIAEGYKPLGGPVIFQNHWFQAVTK